MGIGDPVTRRTLLARASLASAAALASDPLSALARGRTRPRHIRRHRARPAPAPRHAAGGALAGTETFGTELEYYRSDPAHLAARLQACAAAGYTTIQTYVPWNVHENTRGSLDFSGRTRPVIVNDHVDEYQIETPDQEIAAGGLPARVIANTDLLGFVHACAAHGFDVILRPGPFISDEWRSGGLPDWLLLAYPDMFQVGPDGTSVEPGAPFSPPIGTVTGGGPLYYFDEPSYASPDYLREVTRWLGAFARAVRPLLRSQGGPVTAMQVDDEICFYYRFGPFEVDYNPAMVARFGRPPPTDWPAPGGPPATLRPALDWQRFKAEQLGVYLGTLSATLRDGGVDTPIFHEQELQLAPPANFAALAKHLDVLHPEFYLDPGAYTQPTIELCAAAIRAAQRHQRDVMSAEMSESDVFVRHLLTGEGISGFLGFSYTEGIPDDAVADMSVLGRTLRLAGPRLAQSDRVADTAIVWCPEYLYAPYDSTRYGFQRDVRNVIESDVPALATLLIRAGLAFDLLDTDVAQPQDYASYPTVWLVAADVLPRAAQQALVDYVDNGGRLICWPAPPTLDEDYAPCTTLGDALYRATPASAYPEDPQTITVLGTQLQVFRGVQTFSLPPDARAIATRGAEVCGYARAHGSGQAVLLGTWPACDSVPGRIGDVFAIQDVPSTAGASAAGAMARSMAARRWGAAAAAQVPDALPPGAGAPTKVIVFDYANQRRGGEVITGGTVAYWDGENVIPTVTINLGTTVPGAPATSSPEVTAPAFRPITEAHLTAARALHGRPAACATSDRHAQARLLSARGGPAATVSVVNRYDDDLELAITTSHAGRARRLPLTGQFVLPAGAALLLALDYDLGAGTVLEQATVQLLDAHIDANRLRLSVHSPRGGEAVLRLPGVPAQATIDGKPAPLSRVGKRVRLTVPAGPRELEIAWR
jgi:hypothetical protein